MITTNRQEQNELLRKHGYRWKKSKSGTWQLFNVLKELTTVEQALDEIETGTVPTPPMCLDERHAARLWAEAVVARNPLILDTETTGLGPDAQVVEIAVIGLDGTPVLHTLIKPTCAIEIDAMATHGITEEMVQDAPAFVEVWEQLHALLACREIVIYHAAFDMGVLRHCAEVHGLTFPEVRSHCLMKHYAMYAGVVNVACGCYGYHTLEAACTQFEIAVGDAHRALLKTV